jgi:hypothetical protein
MDWARRSEDETPRAEQRELRDERGRLWVGTVTSGTLRDGEDHAEVIFVCPDQPSELKRVARLDVPAADADRGWLRMSEEEVRSVFRRSDPA